MKKSPEIQDVLSTLIKYYNLLEISQKMINKVNLTREGNIVRLKFYLIGGVNPFGADKD